MFRVLSSSLGRAAREVAIETTRTVVATGIGIATYQAGSSTYNFFNKLTAESAPKKDTAAAELFRDRLTPSI
ncbi:hypothetical protein BN59_00756 [Legionella massiliensis]|uniref:Uncharacterized protein n=1 Tax=Legionella massiliensis TaxID=1034943 RepID=A0A078KU39_9GAMM|nr:hypothetical protein [Legionella massiliensis]CDZ76487.1 hypothetical protein BN59_00756 [Legionella massiliensis]CEE12225.1 hypothetical protein BN1094_00756 [Legionella massiliensis]